MKDSATLDELKRSYHTALQEEAEAWKKRQLATWARADAEKIWQQAFRRRTEIERRLAELDKEETAP